MTSSAGVVQVARLPFQAGDGGANPAHRLLYGSCERSAANTLLHTAHYLGQIKSGTDIFGAWEDAVLVACQVYREPAARMLNGLAMLELARWCCTEPDQGQGSQFMAWVRRALRAKYHGVTLVSYSDLSRHSGVLYRASGWERWPTHHQERYEANGVGYPSGHGSWNGVDVQSPKARWRMDIS